MLPFHARRLLSHLDNVKSELTNGHPVAGIVEDVGATQLKRCCNA